MQLLNALILLLQVHCFVINGLNTVGKNAASSLENSIRKSAQFVGGKVESAKATFNIALDQSKLQVNHLVGRSETSSVAKSSFREGLTAATPNLIPFTPKPEILPIATIAKDGVKKVSEKSTRGVLADKLRLALKDRPVKALGAKLQAKVVATVVDETINDPRYDWIPEKIRKNPRVKNVLTRVSASAFNLLCYLKYSPNTTFQNLGVKMQIAFAKMNPDMPKLISNSVINSLCFSKTFPKK
jgi:hypothetical protein